MNNQIINGIRLATVLAFFFSGLHSSFAQNGDAGIKGVIVDSLDGKPVPFANVYVTVDGLPVGGATDFDGKFSIKPLEPGTYNLTVSYQDKKLTITNLLVQVNKMAYRKIEFNQNNVLGVLVIESKPELADMIPTMKTIGSTEIKSSPYTSFSDIVVSQHPAIYQEKPGAPLQSRGARKGTMTMYLDGALVADGDMSIPNGSISQMQIISGGVPAEYGDTTGGVIVVNTHSYKSAFRMKKAMGL